MGIKSIILSNSVEVLFEHLKANLFSEEDGVFSERILIVPSSGLKHWIQARLASSMGVAAGLSIYYLGKGVARIKEQVSENSKCRPQPSHLELFLEIDARLSEILNDSSPDPIWDPLVKYVQGKDSRKIALSSYLTELFEKYGTCAGKAALDWEMRPGNWQEMLWSKVFSSWDYPQRALEHVKVKDTKSSLKIHLFGFNYISPLYFHFFLQAAGQLHIDLYHVSPCQEFWSDLPYDHPSLLGSMGKLGRTMAKMIEDSGMPVEESYLVFGGETQLKRVQRDLLRLQPSQAVLDDSSIQVHQVSTRRDEINALYNYLLALAEKEGIIPSDVVVMAPNIALYAPYIQAIFGKLLDYQIVGMPSQKGSPIVKGLFLLLDLEKKRWSVPAVLALFEHPCFQNKWNFTDEELALIRLWVRQTGIRWGVDGAHRAHLLEKAGGVCVKIEETATWMEGLGYLIEELAMPYEPTRIDFSQAETLGKVVQLITALYQETRALESDKTLSAWTHYFKNLMQSFFLCHDSQDPFFAIMDDIESAQTHFGSACYSYPLIRTLLQKCTEEKNVTINSNQLQAVRFCSLLSMRTVPAKVICLVGINHDAFPRKETLQTLDLLGKHPLCGGYSGQGDVDRSVFLEAILSAREKLYISYLAQDPYDLSEYPPSSVVAHLLPLISPRQIFKHPPQVFDQPAIAAPTLSIDLVTTLPQGEYEITIAEWSRFSRSFLSHYLHSQGLKMREIETLQDEESFLLTPSRKAQVRQKALNQSAEDVLSHVARQGDLPVGAFGRLAKFQLQEEIATLSKHSIEQMVIHPFRLSIHDSLTVTFTGVIEGVLSQGMCVQGKKNFRTAAKAWPLFVLLNACDPSKSQLIFAASDEFKSAFFDDPRIYLKNLVELFFYTKSHPFLLALEWIEPILQQDPKKLAGVQHYDHALKWYLRGRGKVDATQWIEAYYPLLKTAYGAMAHAWF